MGNVIQKAMEKFMGKIVDAQLIEPLGDALINILRILDVDSQPEVKLKIFYARAEDQETYDKERYLCLGFRIVEPVPIDEGIKQLQRIQKAQKKAGK